MTELTSSWSNDSSHGKVGMRILGSGRNGSTFFRNRYSHEYWILLPSPRRLGGAKLLSQSLLKYCCTCATFCTGTVAPATSELCGGFGSISCAASTSCPSMRWHETQLYISVIARPLAIRRASGVTDRSCIFCDTS